VSNNATSNGFKPSVWHEETAGALKKDNHANLSCLSGKVFILVRDMTFTLLSPDLGKDRFGSARVPSDDKSRFECYVSLRNITMLVLGHAACQVRWEPATFSSFELSSLIPLYSSYRTIN
jgi:hypothetical protein